jgi:hypothetical protein
MKSNRILFGWSAVIGFLAVFPFVSRQAGTVLILVCAAVGGACLGRRQSQPLAELVAANRRYWSWAAAYFLLVMAVAFYCALRQRRVMDFVFETPGGWYVLLLILFGPFVPAILRHESARYRGDD